MKSKLILLTILTSFAVITTQAQIRYVPVDAKSFSFNIGGGPAMLFGDFRENTFTPIGKAGIDYNFSNYVSMGIEAQLGKLQTNTLSMNKINDYDIYVTNKFNAFNLNIRVSWGKIFKADPASIVNGFYFGTGVGYASYVISTNKSQESVNDTLRRLNGLLWNGETLTWPVNVGVDFDLSSVSSVRNMAINLNYQHNVIFNDRFDGYNPSIRFNLHKDSYGFLSFALKYYFGRLR